MQIDRHVEGNILYSSAMPKINIKIGSELIFQGDQKESTEQAFINSGDSTYHDTSRFLFTDELEDKIALIQMTSIRRGYYLTKKKKGDNIIESDYKTILKQKYLETVFVINNNGQLCLARSLERVVGPSKNVLFYMVYFENISDEKYTNDSISDWAPKLKLNESQRNFLNNFIERSMEEIEIF